MAEGHRRSGLARAFWHGMGRLAWVLVLLGASGIGLDAALASIAGTAPVPRPEVEPVLLGAYLGFMLTLILSAMAAWRLLGDRLYAWYALYLANHALLQVFLDGRVLLHLEPAAPGWGTRIAALLAGSTVFSALYFAARFLEIKTLSPPMWRLFQTAMAVGLMLTGLVLGGWLDWSQHLGAWSGMNATPVAFAGAAVALRARYTPARYLLLAWGGLLLCVLLNWTYCLGWMAPSAATVHALLFGSVFEATVLAVALGDRQYLLLRDRALLASTSNRYLSRLNIQLEKLVAERTQSLQDTIHRLEEQASRDGLTGLINHRTVMERLDQAIKGSQRHGQALAVLMADLDHFKVINDALGHQVGDEVLQAVAEVLQSGVRISDECGRYGGEEFLMVLPQTQAGAALELAERLRRAVEALTLPALGEHRLTMSFGVAVYPGFGPTDVSAMVRKADDALYQAKARGRNRCVLATPRMKTDAEGTGGDG